jgi:hypothetical protein
MRVCDCNVSFANTGVGTCKNLMAAARKFIFVPTYDSTGARNKIAAGDTLNAAYFTALVNQADATKRWYPTSLVENVEDLRAEAIFETLASGEKIFIQDGPRTVKTFIKKESNTLIGKLLAFQCKDFSAYEVDKNRSLIGSYDGTDLYPIQIENETLSVMLIKATDTTAQKIALSFEFSSEERDEDLRIITETEAGTNLLNLSGLLDVNCATSSPSVTGFVAVLTTDYGTFKSPISVVGWVKADFTLYNTTQSSPITITSVTENPDGTYTFVFPTQAQYDVLTLTASKSGYEFPSTTVTIP